MELFALPESTLETVAQFLLGIDLFRLSHISSYALQTFSQCDLWCARFSKSSAFSGTSAKRAYMLQQSFLFRGSQLVGEPCYVLKWRGISVVVPSELMFVPMSEQLATDANMLSHVPIPAQWAPVALSRNQDVSLDLWFSLAPDEPGYVRGGILLGGQSVSLRSGHWPHCHQQIALVDTHGNLYCSILDETKRPIAVNLQPERWYHLALVWSNGLQRVYLEMELVSELRGSLHHELDRLRSWQVGAGCISADSVGKPHATWCGWLGFRGMIDDARVWGFAMSDEKITQLYRHGDLSVALKPAFSMKRDCDPDHQSARCSRPLKRSCQPWT